MPSLHPGGSGILLGVAFLLLAAAGCRSTEPVVVEPVVVPPTFDSLQAEVRMLQYDRVRLQRQVAQLSAELDSTRAAMQRAVEHEQALRAQMMSRQADSLQRAYVVQFLKGQELRGALRGTTVGVVYFEAGNTQLIPRSVDRLDQIAAQLRRADASARILIEGHSDNTPFTQTQQNNRVLSAERAATVVRYLVDKYGFDPSRFETAGFGSDQPLMPNDTPVGRQLNRRVRIAVLPAS